MAYTQIELPSANDYCCPSCGEELNDNELGYEINGEHYPKRINESKGSTLAGNYWDWDEIHKCENCGTESWFSNGAY